MRSTTLRRTSAFVGSLVLLCAPAAPARAQGSARAVAVTHVASLAPGSIHGTVQDEHGFPVSGAVVSALGTTTSLAVTDRSGRFELRTLMPGPYLLRAHLSGYVASRGQVVDVRPSSRAISSIELRHVSLPGAAPVAPPPILAAGIGSAPEGAAPPMPADPGGESVGGDNHGETAWRLRHVRRGILKETTTVPDEILVDEAPPDAKVFGPTTLFGHAVGSPARFATSLFAGTPFSGQVNLLTTGSFETPQQLFSPDNVSHGIAYLALGAPVGDRADWTVRAALTQGDIASWVVAGEYTTRAPARHRYELGWSYSTQRYEGGNFAALTGVTDGSRNAGMVFGFDTLSISPALTLSYGGRYARYDYLEGRGLVSPRVAVTLAPADRFRISGAVAYRAVAPGAEEFIPPTENGAVWLPPQRTFSSLDPSHPLRSERTNHVEVGLERDLGAATVSVRAFRQHVDDQIVTLFGVDMPAASSHLGHYFVGNAGAVDASGLSTGVRASFARRVHGAIEYSTARAQLRNGEPYLALFAPSALRVEADRIHDVSTSLETEVPETSTRVLLLYRVSNAFARSSISPAPAPSERTAVDSRFDLQVHQSLPFMDFSTARWEMLVAVRNFFREVSPDQSIYDELLVVRPPKRIVGGLTLKF
jgi:hypothetical protein